ncbi:hypothetical protein THASP1DRAFT_29362 [Thamnocephalis sphaerospora]|uniref:Uncharacterized protein n=1 Tax=Thamnocephalis sphaerospora TaxID=78915 RepID=A0A4P9XRV6_9FUNG|nr:hypothetical protein THASP1DRAFT_29362 [Thamnocephalis sphaerospora]|eukprot:RKP08836.1 hypothetical protein THASP1DRAFT_29362 [Thamnocephalis sphaerospora]
MSSAASTRASTPSNASSKPAYTGAAAETAACMDHLWRLSHAVFSAEPALAAHYQSALRTVAHAGKQPVSESVRRRCCERCGVPRVPARTCQVRVAARAQTRCRRPAQHAGRVRETPHANTAADVMALDDTQEPATSLTNATARKPVTLQYTPRTADQRPAGQSSRLHSVRNVDVFCLLCGLQSRYGGATRVELRAASTTAMQRQRQQQRIRKRQQQAKKAAEPVLARRPAASDAQSSAQQKLNMSLATNAGGKSDAPVVIAPTPGPMLALATRATDAVGGMTTGTASHSAQKGRVGSAATAKPANKTGMRRQNTKQQPVQGGKAKKKHALGRLLDEGRKRREEAEANRKGSASLTDFLMNL